jgi:hypothetical protein
MFKRLKILKDVLLAVFILLILVLILSRGKIYGRTELSYGITYSPKQARSLGLDWQQTYLAILDELGVKRLRLSAYWDEVERNKDVYDWADLDWQVDEAEKRGAKIILAIGGRLPRWPECHFPVWAKTISKTERHAEILKYEKEVVSRYKNQSVIAAWQVENEPFLSSYFGECPSLDKEFLDEELALVRSLDARPIVITDSGELSLWYGAASRADIFGTTMYRDTYSRVLKRYIHYPIGPGFFIFKKNVISLFAQPKNWLVIELQAEPWGPIAYQEMSREERDKTMSLEKFRSTMEFARQAGFQEFYLWGAEWWYWEKTVNNRSEFWNEAKRLFNTK